MLKELTEGFEPPNLIGREQQIQELHEILMRFKTIKAYSNRVIFGYTGTGKTAIVRKILKNDPDVFYTSAANCKTALRILKEMAQSKYTSSSNNLSLIIKNLKERPKMVVIDELNQIKDPEELFNYLNTIFREVQIPIILITNQRTITENIPDDARTTLLLGRIELLPYNANDLQQILKHRISLAKDFNASTIPEGFIEYISAIAAKEGSARLALTIAYQCLYAQDFSKEFIDKVNMDVRFHDWKAFLMALSPTEKGFLKVLLRHITDKKFTTSGKLSQDEFFVGLNSAPARVSQLITTFEKEYGFINTEVKNFGNKGGKYRLIRFSNEGVYKNIIKFFQETGETLAVEEAEVCQGKPQIVL